MRGAWGADVSGEVAFGLAISDNCACHPDKARRHCSIVAAGRSGSGKILVDLAPFYDHPRGAVKRAAGLYESHSPVAMALDPKSQAATLKKPLMEAGIIVAELLVEDVAVAHGEFLDLVDDGGLEHLNQAAMTAAVRAGQQRRLAGALAWERRVPVDQSPLEAATVAVWAFRRWEEMSQPGVYAV